ncbi:MAG TPA: diacylglycerol kinase family protein, partial [Terriglobia bacterium]|nr:diacylglycerol kinase family protein [Terriglobia bacterium]
HLTELARRAADARPDLVVSAGGDGTHHYVINGLAGSDVPLGILSLGSGNDFAAGLGIPAEPRAAAEVLLHGATRAIDLARVGTRFYGGIAGAGFDSVVTRFANERVHWVHGSPAYAWAILRCLKYYRPHPVEIRSSVKDFWGDVIFVTVGNSESYGGGVRMAPQARLDDGLLDVCVVPAMSKFELLRWVPSAYRGEHLRHPRIDYFQTSRVTLASTSRLELFGDGEFIQELPATIEAAPRALRVVVARDPGLGPG